MFVTFSDAYRYIHMHVYLWYLEAYLIRLLKTQNASGNKT